MSTPSLDVYRYIIAVYIIDDFNINFNGYIKDLETNIRENKSCKQIVSDIHELCKKYKNKLISMVGTKDVDISFNEDDSLSVKYTIDDMNYVLETEDPEKLIKFSKRTIFYYCDVFNVDILCVAFDSRQLFDYILDKEIKSKIKDPKILEDYNDLWRIVSGVSTP